VILLNEKQYHTRPARELGAGIRADTQVRPYG